MLIKIEENLIVNTESIAKAVRYNGRIDFHMKDGSFHNVLDADKSIWNKLNEVANEQ